MACRNRCIRPVTLRETGEDLNLTRTQQFQAIKIHALISSRLRGGSACRSRTHTQRYCICSYGKVQQLPFRRLPNVQGASLSRAYDNPSLG